MSYADVLDQTGRLANLFVSLGIRVGDRIAVQAEKSSECLLVYLAALRAGAVYLPLNPAYTLQELGYYLADAEPALFVCRPQDALAMAALATELQIASLLTLGEEGEGTLMPQAQDAPAEFSDVACGSDALAAILYTSGTTGRPKGAMLSHGNLRSNAETLREFWRFSPNDRLLHALPVFHTHGLFVATNVTLASGSSMIFMPRFDVREVIRQIPAATVMMGVPTFYVRLVGENDLSTELVAGMRLFVSGSAPLTADTHKKFQAITGHAILERFGMTETNMNTSNPYDDERKAGSVGLPLPGVEVRIADPETGRVTTGEIGSIEIRGPNVFKGYWKMPEKSAEEFRDDGFFITGDLGRIDEDGYLFIVGRQKDLIISGGFNIYPAEVESAIDKLPGVAESAVVGVPHPDLGESVIAVVTLEAQSGLQEADIIEGLAGTLARFKQPRKIEIVGELPRNAMGKVQKAELRTRYAGLFPAKAE